jgi:hypothetical protein
MLGALNRRRMMGLAAPDDPRSSWQPPQRERSGFKCLAWNVCRTPVRGAGGEPRGHPYDAGQIGEARETRTLLTFNDRSSRIPHSAPVRAR